MSAHLRYASYVVRHKWFVFRAGLKVGAPLWRLLIHDWSKLTPAEWFPYVQQFYGHDDEYYRRAWRANVFIHPPLGHRLRDAEAFDKAWLHHQHRNPHHWQHWLLREDGGDTKTLEMPEGLVREMVADWMGAGRAITGQWDVASWYRANARKIVLAPEARALVEALVFPGLRCVCESESKRFQTWSCPIHGIACGRLLDETLGEHPGADHDATATLVQPQKSTGSGFSVEEERG